VFLKLHTYNVTRIAIHITHSDRSLACRSRLPPIVPCHRVVGKDGSLTGYAGGLARKRFLLDLEEGAARLL
jgi:O-6-methylguanine DNA methyltransferase